MRTKFILSSLVTSLAVLVVIGKKKQHMEDILPQNSPIQALIPDRVPQHHQPSVSQGTKVMSTMIEGMSLLHYSVTTTSDAQQILSVTQFMYNSAGLDLDNRKI